MRLSIVAMFTFFFLFSNPAFGQKRALIKLTSGAEKTVTVTEDNDSILKFLTDEGKVQTIDKSSIQLVEYLTQGVISHMGQSYPGTSNKTSQKEGHVDTYCMIVGTKAFLKQKVTVQIDFGQGINNWKPRKSMLIGPDDKPIKFNSMIDALNFMASKGWTFVNAYAITTGSQNVYHWIMKKTVPIDEVSEY